MKKIFKIFGGEYLNDKDKVSVENNVLWKVVYLLTSLLIISVVGNNNLMKGLNITVKTPATNILKAKSFVYGMNKASVSYYELWGTELIRTLSNFTPNNINKKTNLVMNEMLPTDAIKMINKVEPFKKKIVVNKISQTFEFTSKPKVIISDEGSRGKVIIEGVSKTKIADVLNKPKECVYEIRFKFYEGVFYVENFGTDCFKY